MKFLHRGAVLAYVAPAFCTKDSWLFNFLSTFLSTFYQLFSTFMTNNLWKFKSKVLPLQDPRMHTNNSRARKMQKKAKPVGKNSTT